MTLDIMPGDRMNLGGIHFKVLGFRRLPGGISVELMEIEPKRTVKRTRHTRISCGFNV